MTPPRDGLDGPFSAIGFAITPKREIPPPSSYKSHTFPSSKDDLIFVATRFPSKLTP